MYGLSYTREILHRKLKKVINYDLNRWQYDILHVLGISGIYYGLLKVNNMTKYKVRNVLGLNAMNVFISWMSYGN